jgi:hypothetical protein
MCYDRNNQINEKYFSDVVFVSEKKNIFYFNFKKPYLFADADPASVAFRRVHNLNEDNITVVKQMPRGSGSGN